jgi:hypothetical protein
MMTAAERHRAASWTARALLAVAVVAICVAGPEIVSGEPERAGLLLLAASCALVAASIVGEAKSPRNLLLASVTDRLFDGVALATIAWAYREGDPATAAGALAALGASFLAAYMRVRGAALGYSIEESLATRVIRYALVSVGLLAGWIRWTVWVLAGVAGLASAVRASQVAKEERA